MPFYYTQLAIKKEHEHIRNNFSNSEPILIILSQFSSEMDQLVVLKICYAPRNKQGTFSLR